jgi:NitT/TauT family transport system ATP-binding protein
VIRLEKAGKTYGGWTAAGRTPALRDTNLHVREGEFMCILGPSGCGKSTMLNLVAGFFAPTQGRVLFRGRPVDGPAPERGVVFQDPTLFPWMSVRGNVELGLKAAGLAPGERRRRADRWLNKVGLASAGNEVPAALSGGMKQRVALARVLALRPAALLMDEPFTALDGPTRRRLQDELLDLWRAEGQTVMFVTHNVAEAAYLADRVAVMSAEPNTVDRVIDVPLSRPRHRGDPALSRVVEELRHAAESAAGPLNEKETARATF